MTIQKVNTSRNTATRSTYVGEKGRLFYDEANGTLYISDGQTPGGSSIFNKLVNGNYSATLDSSGNFTVPGNLTVQGTTTTVVNETVTNSETITGTLTVTGATSLSIASINGTGQNLFKYSQQLTNSSNWFLESATIATPGTVISPTGSTDGSILSETGTANQHVDIYANFTTGFTTGTQTFSVYGKNNGRQYLVLSVSDSSASNNVGVIYDLVGGTVTKTNTSGTISYVSSSITNAGNGWYRCSVTVNAVASIQYYLIGLSNSGTANITGYGLVSYTLGSTPLSNYIWGAQLNTGTTAGTYTATTTAIVNSPATLSIGTSIIGTQSDGAIYLQPNGTSAVQLGNTAGNYVQISSAASGTSPVISVVGVDPYPSLFLLAKSAPLILGTRPGTSGSFQILDIGQTPTNILRVSASTTGLTPSMSVSGTDTNIGLLFQSKNTGAIDLAAGSSGINISNGNTVTSIVKVSDSLNYTSFPTSVTISNPTTAGGTAATAAVQYMYVLTPTIVSGGTGYSVNDVITFLGGTPRTTGATFNVSSIGALGAITGVTRNATGGFNDYTALPTNPVSVSVAPTGGSGATFNLNYGFAAITLLTAGSGYIETPTITISGGGGTPGSFYAVIGSGTIIRGVGSTSSFYTPSGEVLRLTSSGTNNTNYISIQGDGSGNTPTISSTQNLRFTTGGTASIIFSTNYSGQTELVVSHTASAVNYLQVTGGATGTGPTISAQGSDVGSINLNYVTKNTYASHIFSGAQGLQFQITGPANGTYSSNRFIVYSSATGSSPVFGVTGADPNIDINIQTKGTGSVNITGNLTLNGGGAVSTINKLQTQSFGGF